MTDDLRRTPPYFGNYYPTELTAKEIADIKARLAKGQSIKNIAETYGISVALLRRSLGLADKVRC